MKGLTQQGMKNNFKIFLAALIFLSGYSNLAFAVYDSAKGGAVKTESLTSASSVQKVEVYKLEGRALITKSGTPEEKELKIGDEIEAGDRIFTEEGASISVSFDEDRLNTVTIPSGSEAVFTSLDPVSIRLKNGSVFSSVDGLAEGSTWEIATPVAVAAVRGTEFEVEYSESSGDFSTATYDDENEKKSSAVELKPVGGGEIVKIMEGRQLALPRGHELVPQLIQKMSPQKMERGKKFKEEIKAERKRVIERRKQDEANKGPQGPGGPNGPQNPGGPNSPEGQNRAPGHPNGNEFTVLKIQGERGRLKANDADGPIPVNQKNELRPPILENRKESGVIPKHLEKANRPVLKPVSQHNENKVIHTENALKVKNQPQRPAAVVPAQKAKNSAPKKKPN